MLKPKFIVLIILVCALPLNRGCESRYENIRYMRSYNQYQSEPSNICICSYLGIISVPQYECNVLFMESPNTLPPNLLSNYNNRLRQVHLNGSHMQFIQPGAFNGLSNLEELYLQDNNLQNVTEGVFNSLSQLKLLNLDQNQISYISDYTFMGLNQLLVLTLNSNNLTYLSKGLFKPLWNLELLDISNNPFKIIDQVDLTIRELHLQNIGFNQIKQNYNHLIITNNKNKNLTLRVNAMNLSVLDLSHNNLFHFDKFIFKKAHQLEFLNFSFNSLKNLDSDLFLNLYKLVNLDLSNNNIKQLPYGIFNNLTTLTYLNLSRNHIEQLSYGYFEDLKKIKVLNLSSNALNKFNYLRSRDHSLIKLYLDNNNLSDLDLRNLENFSEISLDKNTWSCEILAKIIKHLQGLNIAFLPGTTYKSENIYKIGCITSAIDKITFDLTPVGDLSNSFNNLLSNLNEQFDNSHFVNFFKHDFKNTLFYKFLNKFNATILTNYVIHQIAVNVSNYQNQNNTENVDFWKTMEALKVDQTDGGDKSMFILYALTFAVYAIIAILCCFFLIVLKKRKRLNMI